MKLLEIIRKAILHFLDWHSRDCQYRYDRWMEKRKREFESVGGLRPLG